MINIHVCIKVLSFRSQKLAMNDSQNKENIPEEKFLGLLTGKRNVCPHIQNLPINIEGF